MKRTVPCFGCYPIVGRGVLTGGYGDGRGEVWETLPIANCESCNREHIDYANMHEENTKQSACFFVPLNKGDEADRPEGVA